MSTLFLDRLMESLAGCLTKDAARKISHLKADDLLQGRVDALAEKANRGELSVAEAAEYDQHLAALHFVTILQAHTRRLLRS